MIFFGHLGIGSKIVARWTRGLAFRYVLIGTVLSDLIDKPLYYGLSFVTGLQRYELGHAAFGICGTRTFGHTALFALALSAVALWKRSKLFAALALGVGSHLLLDGVSDYFVDLTGGLRAGPDADGIKALLWPFMDGFPVLPFASASEHAARFSNPFLLGAEVVGLALLIYEARRKLS